MANSGNVVGVLHALGKNTRDEGRKEGGIRETLK